MKILCLFVLFCAFMSTKTFCQVANETVSAFSSRIENPVTIDVRSSAKDFDFTAENKSWYPYHIEIIFTSLVNLTPVMKGYKADINHGKTNLFTLSVTDIGDTHDYEYDFKYVIGYSNKTAELNYPYPVPLTNGKIIQLARVTGKSDTTFYRNEFMMDMGDTVVCMRKGIVTNVQSGGGNMDRILASDNIEIIHPDGTVAAYSMPVENNILVVAGQQVYPLQPLATLKKPAILSIQMFRINDSATRSIDFKFVTENGKDVNQNSKMVIHSTSEIERELNSKEKKKLSAGELYKNK